MRTHNLEQWVTPLGNKGYLYKRPKLVGKQKYAAPKFIGIRWFRSKAEVLEFKEQYDKPLTKH